MSYSEVRAHRATPLNASVPQDAPPGLAGWGSHVACLEWLAGHHGRAFSHAALASGLPLASGEELPAELVVRAARRLGLSAAQINRRPSRVPTLLMPCIVSLSNGDAALLVGRNRAGRDAQVVYPLLSKQPRWVPMADLEAAAEGPVILLAPEEVQASQPTEQPAPKARRRHWLWATMFHHWPAWLQVVISAFLVNLLGLAFPLFAMNVYDRVIPNAAFATLWALTVGVLLALAFELLLRQLRSLLLDQTGRLVDLEVGATLFAQLLSLRMSERKESAGSLANRIREFDTVRDFFTSSTVIAVTDLMFVGLGIALLWLIVGPIAAIPLAVVPFVLSASWLIQIPLSRSVRRAQQHAARRHGVLIETLTNVEAIKALSAEGVMQRQWEQAVAASARAAASTRTWSALAMYGTITMQQFASVAIIGWGVVLVADGNISMGALIAASMLSARILAPLGSIAQTLARAQQSFASLRAIDAFMRLEREAGDTIASSQRVKKGSLTFKAVSFTYPSGRTRALDCIDLAVAPGERIGVLGRVGSGKSTIGRLVAGFYAPDSGTILIDDIESSRYEPADLRAGVGFVAQETDLLEGTLRDNITLGARSSNESDIAQVCAVTGIDVLAAAHPAGLSMPVGERGRSLSGGQRQAVVLARMLLRKPKILYLDEPTSAMDMSSEADLVRRLRSWLSSEQTLILCTHRVSLLELVDRLVVLDQGRIVADGPKDAVLRQLKLNSGAQSPEVRGREARS